MDKIESTKKIYYDVLPAYNIDTALTYSSSQVFKVGSLVKISIRKKIFRVLEKKGDLKQNLKDIGIVADDRRKIIEIDSNERDFEFKKKSIINLNLKNDQKIKIVF